MKEEQVKKKKKRLHMQGGALSDMHTHTHTHIWSMKAGLDHLVCGKAIYFFFNMEVRNGCIIAIKNRKTWRPPLSLMTSFRDFLLDWSFHASLSLQQKSACFLFPTTFPKKMNTFIYIFLLVQMETVHKHTHTHRTQYFLLLGFVIKLVVVFFYFKK